MQNKQDTKSIDVWFHKTENKWKAGVEIIIKQSCMHGFLNSKATGCFATSHFFPTSVVHYCQAATGICSLKMAIFMP